MEGKGRREEGCRKQGHGGINVPMDVCTIPASTIRPSYLEKKEGRKERWKEASMKEENKGRKEGNKERKEERK
jgi:hypothetical protein